MEVNYLSSYLVVCLPSGQTANITICTNVYEHTVKSTKLE